LPVPSWRGDGRPKQPTQKLAAILSSDVVGYSRLMAANEAVTIEILKSYRDIIARLEVLW
jgi:class 3 adenylate cyclase